jgi:hypothetical protein
MRTVIIVTSAAAALFLSPAFAQQPSQGTASIPDLSGTWGHISWPGFEPPSSGPGPVVNKSRTRQVRDADGRPLPLTNAPLVTDIYQLIGDYTNPILKPHAAAAVKKAGEIALSGVPAPTPANQCRPGGVPFVFFNIAIRMLQQPDKITILYALNHEYRQVRLNAPHPAKVTPSWYGDSIGHYEGDTLVIDTVGLKVGPFSMVDMYGTPYTPALHVVERYQLIDYEAAKEGLERDGKENFRFNPAANDSGLIVQPDYRGKHLQLQFTVEDEGVFTSPWSATVTYKPASGDWPEWTCAENPYYFPSAAIPTAEQPDF